MKTNIGGILTAAHIAQERPYGFIVLLVNADKRRNEVQRLMAPCNDTDVTICFADENTPENIAGYCAQYNGENELVIVVDDFATLSWPVIQVLQDYHANGTEIIVDR